MYACMRLYCMLGISIVAAVGTLYGLLLSCIYIDLYIMDVNVCSALFLYVFVVVRYCLFYFVFFEYIVILF